MRILGDNSSYFAILVFCFLFNSCNNCDDKLKDFRENMEFFDSIQIKLIIDNNQQINLESMIGTLNRDEYELLESLDFKSVKKISDILVFTFSNTPNNNLFEKKVDDKLKTKTTDKSCNYYLFYGIDKNKLEKVSYYENFAECRSIYEKINNQWIYTSQTWNCND